MRWMVDLNILLDVFQQREPFYRASARALSRVFQGEAEACLASHLVTTLHYLLRKQSDLVRANDVLDWVLGNFEIVPQDGSTFLQARSLTFSDFEDAALASAAVQAGCDLIVTRNVRDFSGSPVPALTPEELLVFLTLKKCD